MRRYPPPLRAVRLIVLHATLITWCAPLARAQVFQLQGGGSSLFAGYGGMLNIWGNGYEASLGVGYLDGLKLGLSARRLIGGRDTLRVGNDALPFVLETDVFSGGSVILAQGASLQRRRGRTTVHAFAGASASAVAAPYFASNSPSRAMAYLRAQYDVSRTLSLVGHAVATDRQSLIGSLRWRPSLGVTASAAGGLGNNAPYAAASLDARFARVDVKSTYAVLGERFRRASAPMPLQSELEKENLLVTWRARPNVSVTVGRQHFRQDSSFRGLPQRATLSQISATTQLRGASISSGWFLSAAGHARNVSSYFSARRDITARLQSELYLLRVWQPAPSRITTPVLLLREVVTPRISLLQVITRENGRSSVNFGGTVNRGMSSLSLEYQVAHSPYLTINPFVQTIGLNARVQLGGYALSIGSFVTPDGKVHYSAQGNTFFYRGMSQSTGQLVGGGSGRLDSYIVLGRVVDESGASVEGAALELGGELVYTDSRGRFFQRRATPRKLTVRVVLDDFLVPGTFEVVRAPTDVVPTKEDRAVALAIVVRRVVAR